MSVRLTTDARHSASPFRHNHAFAVEQLGQDLRHGARMPGKNPGFTAVAIPHFDTRHWRNNSKWWMLCFCVLFPIASRSAWFPFMRTAREMGSRARNLTSRNCWIVQAAVG